MNKYTATLCALIALTPIETQGAIGFGFCKVSEPRTTTVQRGDTLIGIAKRYYGHPSQFQDIAAYNSLKDPNKIYVGQIIKLPTMFTESYRLQSVTEPGCINQVP